jgi:hypothetical protein
MYPAPPIDQNNADAKNAPAAPMRFLDGTVADNPALTSPDTKDTMLRSVKSANAIRTTPITSRLMCDGEEAAPRASPRLAEVVTAMVAMLAQGIDHFKQALKPVEESLQPTTSLPGESEQYPIASIPRSQEEVHTLRLAGN